MVVTGFYIFPTAAGLRLFNISGCLRVASRCPFITNELKRVALFIISELKGVTWPAAGITI